jgi:hypothetical protein
VDQAFAVSEPEPKNTQAVMNWFARSPVKLALFGLLAAASVFYGFLWNSGGRAGALLQHAGYYILTATVIWWGVALFFLVREWRQASAVSVRGLCRREWPAAAVIMAIMVIAICSVPYGYKILYDELVLQSTALNMHFFREIGTVATGYEVEGVFRSLNIYVDKRPFFFPYLVSLLHDLTGFRALNGFVLNTVLMPVVLVLFYIIARRFGGRWAGLAGMVCFGATPLMAQNANGVGMEMLNLAMILTTLLVAVHYLEKPEGKRLSALVLSCVLLAQTRYESAAYVLPVSIIILEGWRRRGEVVLPLAGVMAPVLLIPCALQNVYVSAMPALWDLHENTSSRFDVAYLAGNLKHALRYFFVISTEILNSVWLSVFGFTAIIWVLFYLGRNMRHFRSATPLALVVVLMGVGAAGNLGLLMFYYWGQLDDVLVFRLSLPFNVMQGFAIAWALGRLPERWAAKATGLVAIGGMVFYITVGIPASARHGRANYIATEIEWGEEWVERQPPKARLIIVSTTALNWFLKRTSALSFNYAAQRAEHIAYHMAAGTFQEVLVFQYYRPSTSEGDFVLDPQTELPARFVLEPLVERSLGSKLLRVSRLIEIKPEPRVAAGSSELNAMPTGSTAIPSSFGSEPKSVR